MHIRQLPSGNWRVVVQYKGTKRGGTAPSRIEATQLGARLLTELGATRKRSEVTIGEAILTYINNAGMASTTRSDYEWVAARLPGWFTQRPAGEVDVLDVEHLYRTLAAEGWTPHRIHRVYNVVSGAFGTCMRYGWSTHNPASAAIKPERPTREIVPPSPAQVAKVLAAADVDFVLFMRLASTTGARRGELVGLQWADIQLDRAQVLIRRSLVYTPKNGVEERPTKTGKRGHRLISIGLPTVTALRRHHATQVEHALEAGLSAPVWVFSHDAGVSPWRPDFATHAFSRAREAAGVHGVRLHDLRHFVATQMLDAGESVVQVAGRLGHASPTTTADIYAHWIPRRDVDVAERLDSLLDL